MKKWKVLFTAEADNEIVEQLESTCDVEYCGWNVEKVVLDEDALIEKLQGKQIYATSYDKVTRKVIEQSNELKLIVCTRANPVNIDLEACKECGVQVAYTPGRNSDVTAEFAVALLLDVARNLSRAYMSIRDLEVVTDDTEAPEIKKVDVTWGKVKNRHPYSEFQGVQIKNKKMGIVGYGSIGKRVANIIRGFGAEILIYDPYCSKIDIEQPGVRMVAFQQLIEEADFISCHMKVTPQTTGMFNLEVFKQMKQSAIFINNSRGAIVVEADLIEALKTKEIAGAGLDVFDYEPLYAGHPFVNGEVKNITVTPHISGASEDSITNGTIMLVDEVQRYISGEPLLNQK